MRIARLLPVLLLVACGDSVDHIVAPPPDGALSMLIFFSQRDEPVRVLGVDIRQDSAVRFETKIENDLDATIHVIHLDYVLAGYGVHGGWLDTSATDYRFVPKPRKILVSRAEGDTRTPWETLDRLPDALAGIRLPRTELQCAKFAIDTVPIDQEHTVTFVIALDDESAFVGLVDGRFFRVTKSGATQLSIPPNIPSLAAYRDANGEFWLAGRDRALARGHPDIGFTIVLTSTLAEYISDAWIDGPRGADPFELFMATELRTFDRFDGVSWDPIDQGPGDRSREGSVVWIRPGEAIAVGVKPQTVVRYRDGELIDEPVNLGPLEATIDSAGFVPGLGTLLGTSTGRLPMRQQSAWTEVASSPQLFGILVIEPLDEGVLFGGINVSVPHYHPMLGSCPYEIYATDRVRRLAPMPNGFVAANRHDVVFLTRTNPREIPECNQP